MIVRRVTFLYQVTYLADEDEDLGEVEVLLQRSLACQLGVSDCKGWITQVLRDDMSFEEYLDALRIKEVPEM